MDRALLFISLVICISSVISQFFPDGVSDLPDSEYDKTSTREAHTHRHRLLPMQLAASTQRISTDGRIIFPGNPIISRMAPDLPLSCSDSTFCENVPNYPKEFIMNAIKARRNEFMHLAIVDPPFDVGQRIGVSEFESLCDTDATIVFPKAAKTIKDEWLFIVNTESERDNEKNFQQGFRIQRCSNPNDTCKIVDHAAAASGYDTVCKQQHIVRQALGVKNGELTEGVIMLPTSCCCYLRYRGVARGEVSSRMADMSSESAPQKGMSRH
uniref:Spz_0 protein n=2 Tax=Fopius arisanus TaxID=64838 RepID=A0A0C9RM54_9HYME